MKQTAVEWLYDNLKSHFEHDGDLLEVVQFSFEQAKEMEKEQMFDIMQQFASFCVKCDREKLPLLFAKEWFKQFEKK